MAFLHFIGMRNPDSVARLVPERNKMPIGDLQSKVIAITLGIDESSQWRNNLIFKSLFIGGKGSGENRHRDCFHMD